MEATDLTRRARRAYELGRLRLGLKAAPFVVVAGLVAVACGRPLPLCCALALLALPLAIGLIARGGGFGRAAMPGLCGGWAALLPPLLLGTAGHACFGSSCMSLCLPACGLGGALGGALIGRALGGDEGFRPVLLAALLAGLVGAMGCSLGGTMGVLGMIAGAVVGTVPALAWSRR